MKKYILITCIFLSYNFFAQSKDEIIKTKDNEIKILNNEILNLKKIISEANFYHLKEKFDKKFVENYFSTRDLSKENDLEKFKPSYALINIIRIGATDAVLKKCDSIDDFNKNYIILFELRETVLNKKYDESKVNDALDKIKKLPEIAATSKLGISKKMIYDLLYNYRENSCLLKKQLDNYKTKSDQKAMKPLYEKLENDLRYKNYQYLKQVIVEMKMDLNSYTGDDDLSSCIEVKEIKKDTQPEK
jgi:hypothetical protein